MNENDCFLLKSAARPPSRLKWRADLVTVVTEGLKVPTTTATAKARKSILSVVCITFHSSQPVDMDFVNDS